MKRLLLTGKPRTFGFAAFEKPGYSGTCRSGRKTACRRGLLVLLLVLFPVFAPYAQEPDEAAAETRETDAVYVIRKINYYTKGWTQSFAIEHNVDLKEGVEFQGKAQFEAWVARKTQDLRNQRVFEANGCRIDYTLEDAGEDKKIPVVLDVYTEDSWNIIALPEPKYDSNTGLSFSIKARDYNFLGTMNPLAFDIGYELDTSGRHQFSFLLDFDYPFRAFGLNWNVNFDNELCYRIGAPLYYRNTTGLSVELPWETTVLGLGFNQHFFVNAENGTSEKNYLASLGKTGNEKDYFDGLYMATELFAWWSIPTGIEAGNFGGLYYTLSASETLRYSPAGDIGAFRASAFYFGHSLGFGRIDWIGNLRQGLSVNLSKGVSINQYTLNPNPLIGLSVTGHQRFNEIVGFSGRFRYQAWLSETYDDAGDILRGVKNDGLSARQMLSLNIEFPIRVIRFVPSEWFRRRSLRVIDGEVFLAPFIDIAIADDPSKKYGNGGASFDFSGIITTAGIEVIGFPLRWRSFFIRASAGFDMRRWLTIHTMPTGKHREFYIGLGHFF